MYVIACVFMYACTPMWGLFMCLMVGRETIVLAKSTHDCRKEGTISFLGKVVIPIQITVVEHLLSFAMFS